jgi:hypothetical protein
MADDSGDNPELLHSTKIGEGGYGTVHKVHPSEEAVFNRVCVDPEEDRRGPYS